MSEDQGDYITESAEALRYDYIVENAQTHYRQCGIYFLVKDSEIVYVGQSVNVPNRIKQHKRDKDFDRWFFVKCGEDDLDELEVYYIHKFVPKLNKKLYGLVKPQKPINWLKKHPVFSKFNDLTLKEWMKRAGMDYDDTVMNGCTRDLPTFGLFYKWLKHRYPYLEEKQILPREVTLFFAEVVR